MANNYWKGGAAAVAQVDSLTPGGTIEAGDLFICTLTGEDGTTQVLSVAATNTTVAITCDDIVAAWNASTLSLFASITASDGTTKVTLTADTAGVPFYLAASTTEAGGGAADDQTFARAAVTACSGPKDWGTAANWYTGAVPTTGDSVTLDARGANEIIYGMNQAAVTLAVLYDFESMGYAVGSLTSPLRIGITDGRLGMPPTDGSSGTMGPRYYNLGTIQGTIHAYNSANVGENGQPAINLIGSHASNVVNVYGPVVMGIGALIPGETATVATINMVGSGVRSAQLTVGAGVTLTTLRQDDGKATLRCAATTITQDGGELVTEGSGAITTATVNGKATINSTGTITTLNVNDSGRVDLTQSNIARTISNATIYGNGEINDDNGVGVWTNGVIPSGGARSNQVNFGARKVAPV